MRLRYELQVQTGGKFIDGKKTSFIKEFAAANEHLDMEQIDKVVSQCLDRYHDKYLEYPRGHMNMITAMEELGELAEAISRRIRGRVSDNYDILQEMADVIIAIWCIGENWSISHSDIRKAVNVKIGQEMNRIAQHTKGLPT